MATTESRPIDGHGTSTSIVGVFAHVDTTVRALEDLRAKGYHDLTVYTPVPVHESEDVLERDRPVSPVRLVTLLGGLRGTISGFLRPIWASVRWGRIPGLKAVAPVRARVRRAVVVAVVVGGGAAPVAL